MCSRQVRLSTSDFLSGIFNASIHASPRAVTLFSPYLDWRRKPSVGAQDSVSKWVAAISVAPHTEEVAQSAVDTLLQIAANRNLRPSIPPDVWLWLNKRPSLPPDCEGRRLGDDHDIVRTIRGLNDIEILTSYLTLIWSEWKPLFNSNGFVEMCASIREDFNRVGNGHHRAELIQRVDYILGELDRRSGRLDINLEDDESWCNGVGRHSQDMKDKYGKLKRMLQEVDQEATEILNCMPHSSIFPSLLTLMDLYRIPLRLRARPASPVSIISHLERSSLCETNRLFTFPFHIVVVSMRSPRRLGTVPILPRHVSFDAPAYCSLFFTMFPVFCLRAYIIFVKHDSFSIFSLSQQTIIYLSDVTQLNTVSSFP